jgi:hypothetical protein
MSSTRVSPTATLLPDGKVLVAGGFSLGVYFRTAELYDPATGTWSTTGSMTSPRVLHTATLLPNGRVLVTGGRSSKYDDYPVMSELYDPASGTWSADAHVIEARYGHAAALLPNGRVLVVGGGVGTPVRTAELYTPR